VELTFDRVLGILGIILTIIFIVLDKAGKLRGPALLGLLGLAALMTLPIALGNSWVKSSPWGMLGFSKSIFMVSLVAICYSALAIWISPSTVKERTDKDTQSNPDAKLGPPHSEIERPIGSAEPPATTSKKSVSTGAFSTPTADEIDRERQAIVMGLIEKFKRSHKGKFPTFEWVNQRLKDQGQNFQVVQPNAAAVITDSIINVNGGTAILNETGKPLIIDNTYIGGKDGIVTRLPKKDPENTTKAEVMHPSVPPTQQTIIQAQPPYGNLSKRCESLGDGIIRFVAGRNQIKPELTASNQKEFWDWYRVNDGLFRSYFFNDSKTLLKDLEANNVKDPHLNELIEKHEKYVIERNKVPPQFVFEHSMMFHLRIEEIEEIGQRFKKLATEIPGATPHTAP
jgi:hypothetical protein